MKFVKLISLFASVSLCLVAAGCVTSGGKGPKPGGNGYGPLTFNRAGGDFYFSQDGRYARTELAKDGVIEIHLKGAPFQVGYNGEQLNLALAQISIPEISTDPKGYKASSLSGAMTGARAPDSDVLFVYSGSTWNAGNTEFSDGASRKAAPMPGYQHAYQVNNLDFTANKQLTLAGFRGTVYGFIVVYKQRERLNRDIMPVRLIFD